MLAFAIGQGFNPAALTLQETVLFACFPIATGAGLGLAWVRPVAGGAVSLGGLAGFYLLHLAMAGRLPAGVAFIVISLPGGLFLMSEWLRRAACRSGL